MEDSEQPCGVPGDWVIPAEVYDDQVEGAGAVSTWLRYVQEDVNEFRRDNTTRLLRIFRNRKISPAGAHLASVNEFRIGYMSGLNEDASPISFTDPLDGLIECPDCTGTDRSLEQNYNFSIDSLDALNNIVYAHYSFQIAFGENGDYSVFVDGCCRPTNVINNFQTPFHLRAGIQLYEVGKIPEKGGFARPYPARSIVVNMPSVIILREGGISYDKCTETSCEIVDGEEICFLRFGVQAYHPLPEYRSKLRVRLANAGETGWWRCGGEWAISGANGDWKGMCRDGIEELSFRNASETVVETRQSGNGFHFVKFMVSRSGEGLSDSVIGHHSLSLMVDCLECVNGATQSVPLEVTVHVKKAQTNADPPFMTFKSNPVVDVDGVNEVVPLTCPQDPMRIYCGRERFELGSKYSQTFLRIGFKDVDDEAGPKCDGPDDLQKDLPQMIKSIQPASTLPPGITFGGLVTNFDGLGYLNDAKGTGYVDLTWRPACENPTHLGLQQFCFSARDTFSHSGADATNFAFLDSMPSFLDVSGFNDNSNDACPIPLGFRSSCIFIDIERPKANVAPAFVLPTSTKGSECSSTCCDCCDSQVCSCMGVTPCCATLFTTIGQVFKHQVRVVDGPIQDSDADSAGYFPAREDHDNYAVFINFTIPADISPAPRIMPLKFGCGATPYEECQSNLNRRSDALTELVWDLKGLGYSCYKPNDNFTVPCQGPQDVQTCEGGSECKKDAVPIPFKVCYRAQEELAPWVDANLWTRTYREAPTKDSCEVCLKLAIADRPIFLDDDDASPVQGHVFEVAAGRELRFSLTAAAANDGDGEVLISILSDPGAPFGAALGSSRKEDCSTVKPLCQLFHGSGYQRDFVYTPLESHAGQRFKVCFIASMAALKPGADASSQVSEPRCIYFEVLQVRVSWKGTTPSNDTPQAHINTTVGCKVAYDLQATGRLYNLRIEHLQLPRCDNCIEGGLSVQACSETENVGPCCGNGVCDGAEMGANCAQDCPEDDSSLRLIQNGSKTNDYVSKALFRWTPTRGMEGRRLLACFSAVDAVAGSAAGILQASGDRASVVHPVRTTTTAPSFCVVVDVDRCQYCVPDGVTMMYLAKHYTLNVDWLRLYNTNPRTSDPDDIFVHQKLVIGPTYKVHAGDTLMTIAASAKTTVRAILEYNPGTSS